MEEVKSVETPATDTEKIFAFLSYVFFFGILIYKTQKDSDFVQFHSRQGMVLFLINFVGNLFLMVIPILGWALMFFLNIAVLILFVIGALNSLNGNKKDLPVVGQLSNIIK